MSYKRIEFFRIYILRIWYSSLDRIYIFFWYEIKWKCIAMWCAHELYFFFFLPSSISNNRIWKTLLNPKLTSQVIIIRWLSRKKFFFMFLEGDIDKFTWYSFFFVQCNFLLWWMKVSFLVLCWGIVIMTVVYSSWCCLWWVVVWYSGFKVICWGIVETV